MNNKHVEMDIKSDSKSEIYYDKIEDINTYFKIPLYITGQRLL